MCVRDVTDTKYRYLALIKNSESPTSGRQASRTFKQFQEQLRLTTEHRTINLLGKVI